VEGTPAFGNALPFAGRRRNEGLDRFMSTAGTSSPPRDEPTTPRGARVAHKRRGTVTFVVPAAAGGGGKVPRSELLGPCSPALFSNGHRRKRWSDRGVARKRRVDRRAAFGVSALRRSCDVAGPAPEGLITVRRPLVILLREGKVARPNKHARTRAPSKSLRGNARWLEVRESDARECVRASEVSCRNRWAVAGSREAPVGASREQREAGRWAGTGI